MWGMDDNSIYIAFAFLMAGVVAGSMFGYTFGLLAANWSLDRWSERETMKTRKVKDPHDTDKLPAVKSPQLTGNIYIRQQQPVLPMPGMQQYNWLAIENRPTGPIPVTRKLKQFAQPNTDPIQQLDPRFEKRNRQQENIQTSI